MSKVEARAINSDVNINQGNSGGPLFNSFDEVIGITTFADFWRRGGPGISKILRIEETFGVIDEARAKMKDRSVPQAEYLPVEPEGAFPLDAIKNVVLVEKFDMDGYFFAVGTFQVTLRTPPLNYRLRTRAEREAAKPNNKRTDKDGAGKGTFAVLDHLQGWREYVGEYKPVLILQAMPNITESFWELFGPRIASTYGIQTPANRRFKTGFYRMKLMCGAQEVVPIHPGKVAHIVNEVNYFVRATDASYEGFYTYPASAISSSCGKVRLEVFSEQNPEKAHVKILSEKTVSRIEEDFQPYFARYGRP